MNLRQAFISIEENNNSPKISKFIAFLLYKNESCYAEASFYQSNSKDDRIQSNFNLSVYMPISESNIYFQGETIEDAIRDVKPIFRNLHYYPVPEYYLDRSFAHDEILSDIFPEFGALTDGITVKNGHEKDATDFLRNFVYPKNDQVKQCRPIPKKKQ
jgi:hypothetical protein